MTEIELGYLVPVGGNAFITEKDEGSTDEVTDEGLVNWSDTSTICSTYLHFGQPGSFELVLRLRVPTGTSRIRVSLADTEQAYVVDVVGQEQFVRPIGSFTVTTPGYSRLDLQGVIRVGAVFAEIYEMVLYGYTGRIHYVNHTFSYYFGRRGPSVHLRPGLPAGRNLQYFYTEVTVPVGQDTIGSYYMATGFNGGYFGFQVNSPEERRILFSIWSAYETDDPDQVPDDYKVELLRKGEEVLVQEFGDEGTGLQSILRYDWVAGQTYKFLVYGSPRANSNDETIFTGWFWTPSLGDWQLMASFMRPKTTTYLVSLYSFLENFVPEQGNIERMAYYDNQWVRDTTGVWQELTSATFTGDATSQMSRLDYAGGLDRASGRFYLRNCGFFSDGTPRNIQYIREPTNTPPVVVLEELP